MWRTGIVAAGIFLAAITPGAALVAVAQWGPVVLAISTLAGSALAVATVAYRKATTNAAALEALSKHIPKRATDMDHVSALSSVNVPPTTLDSGALLGTATLHQGDTTK